MMVDSYACGRYMSGTVVVVMTDLDDLTINQTLLVALLVDLAVYWSSGKRERRIEERGNICQSDREMINSVIRST